MSASWTSHVHPAQGYPSVHTDVPPAAVFMFLFLVAAVGHMTIFQKNNRHGHKFLMNALCFGFCMARLVTLSLRISWACLPSDRNIAIASTIFNAAGTLILFVVNIIFAQRILRGLHPHIGWHSAISTFLKVVYVLIPLLLIMVVTATTQSFFTTDRNIAKIDQHMQQAAACYFVFVSFLPIPLSLFAALFPRKVEADKFGRGLWWHKISLLLVASVLLCLGASFRAGTSFQPSKAPHPWYTAKWTLYFFTFGVEFVVVYLYLFLRIDRLFHIPDGARGPGSYSKTSGNIDGNNGRETARKSDDTYVNSTKSERLGSPIEKSEV